jgi:hypothetical protein
MLTDYNAWRSFEKPNEEEFEDEDFDLDDVVAAMADPDAWEEMISSGPRT